MKYLKLSTALALCGLCTVFAVSTASAEVLDYNISDTLSGNSLYSFALDTSTINYADFGSYSEVADFAVVSNSFLFGDKSLPVVGVGFFQYADQTQNNDTVNLFGGAPYYGEDVFNSLAGGPYLYTVDQTTQTATLNTGSFLLYRFEGEPTVTLTVADAPNAVSAAPEPGIWALMFAGVAMIGGALRLGRRKQGSIATA